MAPVKGRFFGNAVAGAAGVVGGVLAGVTTLTAVTAGACTVYEPVRG
jgi:hypothetical protein